MNTPRMMLATAALLGASLLPSNAFAQSASPYPYVQMPVQCAVGYIAGPERVAITMLSPNEQDQIDVQANVCTNLIAQGIWTGIDSQGSWSPGMHIVAVIEAKEPPARNMNIWSTPDVRSTGFATVLAQAFDQRGDYWVAYPYN